MPRRPLSHQLEDQSRLAFQKAIPQSWVFRNKSSDYGIDGELEVFEENGNSTGLQCLVQLKSKQKTSKTITLSAQVEWIKYYAALDLPVLLVVWIQASEKIYWMWSSDVDLYYAKADAKSLTITFSKEWTTETNRTIERSLRFRRALERKQLTLPLQLSIRNSLTPDITDALKTLLAYLPHLIVYADSAFDIDCEFRRDELVVRLGGPPGTVFHGFSQRPTIDMARLILFVVVAALSVNGMVDLAAEIWEAVPNMEANIQSPDMVRLSLWTLVRANARAALSRLVESVVDKEDLAWALYPLYSLASTAPPHRREDIRAAITQLHESMLSSKDSSTRSVASYNLANFYSGHDEGKAISYFVRAIRESDFYQKKDYFWKEFAGSLFNLRRYRASLRAYAYARDELKDTSIENRYADALMHVGRYEDARSVFNSICEQEIDSAKSAVGKNTSSSLYSEALVKLTALKFLHREFGIASQSREVEKSQASWNNVDYSNADVAEIASRSIRLDALNGTAWFNLGVSSRKRNALEEASNSFLMAAVCRTGDDEAWLNAVGLMLHTDTTLTAAILEYVRAIRGTSFIRFLAANMQLGADEESKLFFSKLIELISTDLPAETPPILRIHHENDWDIIDLIKTGSKSK